MTWPATTAPTADHRRRIADAFGAAATVLLLPPTTGWSPATVVEVRVDRHRPDDGQVAPSVVVREDADPVVSLDRVEATATALDCERRTDGTWERVVVRRRDGCLLRGPVSFVRWIEDGFEWQAQSTADADALPRLLERWTSADFGVGS